MGWAARHLSESARRDVARELFRVVEEDEGLGELRGRCPFHADDNPSFSYNYKKDVFLCFAGCVTGGDLVDLFALREGLDKREGLRRFRERYAPDATGDRPDGPAKPVKVIRRQGRSDKDMAAEAVGPRPDVSAGKAPAEDLVIPEEVWARFPPLPKDWLKRLAEVRGWSAEALKRLDVRLQTIGRSREGKLFDIREPERVAIPVRDLAGRLVNIRLYRPFPPKHDGDKTPKIMSWGRGYGSGALFPPSPPAGGGPVLYVEGEPDAICAVSQGFNGSTHTGKPKCWTPEQLEPYRDRDVVVVPDEDEPGHKYAELAARNLATVARTVRILRWPACMRGGEEAALPDKRGQDLTDFFVKHKKTAGDLEALISSAILVDKPKAEELSVPWEFWAIGESGRSSFKPSLLVRRIMQDVQLCYDPKTGLLYQYTGQIWEQTPLESVQRMAIRYLGLESSKSRVNDVSEQVRILSTLERGREMNDRHDWICLDNGLFSLRTFELIPHDRDYLATYKLGVRYDPDHTQKCKRWLKFLDETVQEPGAIAAVQEFFGLCLTRDTRYGKALLLFGPGSDGKSVVLKILQALVGFENCSAVSFKDLEDQFHRASLYGKLLNVATEVGGQALESPYFKAIVTGDPISASFKHQTPFEYRPFCKLAFACNKLPRVLDNSDGYFRRLLMVEFKRQFMGQDADTHLEDELLKELDGIFEWALVGLDRLRRQNGFTDGDDAARLLLDYKRLNNPILCFVEDECVLGDGCQAKKDDLYEHYKTYCRKRNYSVFNYENFFRELKSAHNALKTIRPRTSDPARPRYLSGIGILSSESMGDAL